MGLKRTLGREDPGGPLCLNRTSVGLKPAHPEPREEPPRAPQSNQRGIETLLCNFERVPGGPRLNRTSVGLKREIPANAHFSHFWPQSNQRGIETKGDVKVM